MSMHPLSASTHVVVANVREAPSLARWLAERKTILTTITIGAVTWPIAMGAAWLLWPERLAPNDRVAYALQLTAGPATMLLLMIASCMRLFDQAGAEDPFAARESRRFKVNQRVLTNTLEQAAVFVPLLLALATRLPAEHIKLLPVAVTIWCAGRVLFWAGYHVAPHWRAPGFDWTLLTTALVAGTFGWTLL